MKSLRERLGSNLKKRMVSKATRPGTRFPVATKPGIASGVARPKHSGRPGTRYLNMAESVNPRQNAMVCLLM